MRLSSLAILASTFTAAAGLSVVAAMFSADLIEDTSKRSVKQALVQKDLMWTKVHAEGLQVFLTGVAPTEADRFRAISTAGGIVDAARVIDNMQVEATADLAPPRFSVEILRNDHGIQLIGLIPESADRARMLRNLRPAGRAEANTCPATGRQAKNNMPRGRRPGTSSRTGGYQH